MKTERARSQQEIFTEMHRELRVWNPQIPESPERLDPILRIVLQLYSNQLAKIDSRVDRLWDVASDSLLKSLYPECKRWPVPAYTVMRCEPVDPTVNIDPHTKFYYREKREGGQTFFFSAQREEKLVKAELKQALLRVGSTVVDITAPREGTPARPPIQELPFGKTTPGQIYLAIEHVDQPGDFANSPVFLRGNDDVLNQLRWAYWYPSSSSGAFYEDSAFCPGLTCSIDDMISTGRSDSSDWGGLRSSADLFKQLESGFAIIPEAFANTWEIGPREPELAELMTGSGIPALPDGDRFYWIRLDLPQGGDKRQLSLPLEAHFGAFIATNKNELTLFKHTGGNRVVEIELPEPIDHVLDVTSVVDSSGRDYQPHHVVQPGSSAGSYSFEDRENKLVLWFDFSSTIEAPPESLTVTYSITAGVAANGIEAGQITDLYENHPGIAEVENVISAGGAIPAKTEEQIVTEVSVRLRSRDRALSFSEIARWATGFDPRISNARSENGIQRSSGGVRRCIVVTVSVSGSDFYSDDELNLLQTRLKNFLKSRAPVNTQFKVEMTKT
jgi:hypothetical protein